MGLKAGSAAIAAGGAPEYVAYVAGQAEFCCIKAIGAVGDDGYMAGACPKQAIPR